MYHWINSNRSDSAAVPQSLYLCSSFLGLWILACPCANTGRGGDQGSCPTVFLFVFIIRWCLHVTIRRIVRFAIFCLMLSVYKQYYSPRHGGTNWTKWKTVFHRRSWRVCHQLLPSQLSRTLRPYAVMCGDDLRSLSWDHPFLGHSHWCNDLIFVFLRHC